MRENGSTGDPLSWRRPHQSRPAAAAPQLVSMPRSEAKAVPRHNGRAGSAWKDKDNWRTNAAPLSQPQPQPIHYESRHPHPGAAPASRLSSSLGTTSHDHLTIPAAGSHPNRPAQGHNPWANGVGVIGSGRPNSSLKPSSIGTGSALARSSESGVQLAHPQPQPHHSRSPPAAHPATFTLTQPTPGPATKLHSLQLGRFLPFDAKPHTTPLNHALTDKERNENWMLTPTSSLPSLPGTPTKPRDRCTDGGGRQSLSNAESRDRTQAVDANALNRRREHESRVYGTNPRSAFRGPPHASNVSPLLQQQQQQQLPTALPVARISNAAAVPPVEAGSAGASLSPGPLLGRSLIQASPKRSPLSISTRLGAKSSVYGAPALILGQAPPTATTALSPGASPKLQERTLSPIARLSAIDPAVSQRELEEYPSVVAGLSSLRSPGAPSRRDSITSVTSSVQGGYSLARSRRSSQVRAPSSPIGASMRVGVYRPPHLRNRGSVSGLRPSVAHYDRVRTPHLRGQSRSRESSVSLSRGGSRPPSSLAFYRSDTIPEHGPPDASTLGCRERLQSMSSVAGSIREDGGSTVRSKRHSFAAPIEAGNEAASERDPDCTTLEPRAEAGRAFDGAYLVAKLEEQSRMDEERMRLVRRNGFDPSDYTGPSVGAEGDDDGVDDGASQASFDFSASEMMHYAASDGYALSRHASTLGTKPPGDVFEIGDRLAPGLEHQGQTIRIADTTPGFVEQNADLTGSQLEVVRKLGEGSYAVVYLVREVESDEAALTDADGAFDIAEDEGGDDPAQSAAAAERCRSHQHDLATTLRNGPPSYEAAEALIHADDDADETMRGQASEDLLSTTLKARAVGTDTPLQPSLSLLERRRRKDAQQARSSPTPGRREFALKCLCKRDLPEDMLEVQRLEATIHQSIPAHPNIVTLYRTYETHDWLFLVLEYCPGQDLYYWLEQAQDTDESAAAKRRNANGDHDDDDSGVSRRRFGRDSASPRYGTDADDDDGDRDRDADMALSELAASPDATPPSPSLLASTAGSTLLSRRRVRLIARMFCQICDAVQFCHDRGISHRDIKPENFIVEDRRYIGDAAEPFSPDHSVSTAADSLRDVEARVIVKMTDFGLATAEERCRDFDCGSKPYMAFECHNNISDDYDPKQADIWSLGVVLLNLLFHRNPFTEPSSDCPSFAAYCYDPIRFLMESFDGLTETVARFLAENVFCSVSDEVDARNRVSAGDFSRWTRGLVEHLDLNGPGPGRISRGASMYATTPLIHSRTTSISTLPSMLGSPKARPRSILRDTSIDLQNLNDFNPDATFRTSFLAGLRDSMSPAPGLFTPDVLPSPRFTPSPRPFERNPFDAQYGRASPLPVTQSPEQQQQQTDPIKPSNLRQEITIDSAAESASAATSLDTDYHQDWLDREEVDVILQCESATPKALAEILQSASRLQSGPSSESGGQVAEAGQDDAAELEAERDAAPEEADAAQAEQSHPEPLEQEQQHVPQPSGDEGVDRPEQTDGLEGSPDDDDAKGEGASDSAAGPTGGKLASGTASNHSKRRKRGARKGRTLAKQLKRSQSVEILAAQTGADPEARAREREATIQELALASQTLARQMSKMSVKPAGAEESGAIALPSVSLSAPTAAAAAKYSLEALSQWQKAADAPSAPRSLGPSQDTHVLRRLLAQRNELAAEAAAARVPLDRSSVAEIAPTPSTSATISASTSASALASVSAPGNNWSSAAQRRERISERKSTAAGPVPQDSGRSKPMSWRDRNPSTTTFSSMTSNSTLSSLSSMLSESSSVYSTASAPAALPKRDPSLRSRSRTGGLLGASGLGTISEREKPPRRELDASYLAGIFGGDEVKAMEKKHKEAAAKVRDKAKKLETSPYAGRDAHSVATAADKGRNGRKASSADVAAVTASPSPSSPSTSFVSRFRRPGSSSSSSKSKESAFKLAEASNATDGAAVAAALQALPLSAGPFEPHAATAPAPGGIGLRRDASTSTSSLQAAFEADASAVLSTPSKRNGVNGTTVEAAAPSHGVPLGSPLPLASGNDNANGSGGKAALGEAAPAAPGAMSAARPSASAISDAVSSGAIGLASPAASKKRGMGKFFSGVRDTLMNR
ncbi:hypothetical protein ACQY0O_004186 [Thecaphora frezii]